MKQKTLMTTIAHFFAYVAMRPRITGSAINYELELQTNK